jgi:hypothetical protein
MTIRMYHPELEPPNNECEALSEAQAAVYRQSGWLDAPEPEERVGYASEPVRYAPVAGSEGEPSRPAVSANRADWAAWVDHLGGRSEGLTKAELQAKADELEADED